MMHNHVVLVLAGGAAHFLTGWAFTSDMLFGKYLKKENGKNKDKQAHLSNDPRMNMAAQLVASMALSMATCVAIAVFEKYQAPVGSFMAQQISSFFGSAHANKSFMNAFHTVMFIWAGFIVPTSFGEVIWCGHNWKNWIVEMGMELTGLLAIAATVVYLG